MVFMRQPGLCGRSPVPTGHLPISDIEYYLTSRYLAPAVSASRCSQGRPVLGLCLAGRTFGRYLLYHTC